MTTQRERYLVTMRAQVRRYAHYPAPRPGNHEISLPAYRGISEEAHCRATQSRRNAKMVVSLPKFNLPD